jgi:hypothetical protein
MTVSESSPARLVGIAECRDLRWPNDYEAQANPEKVSPIPNLPPFDMSITFEAHLTQKIQCPSSSVLCP